MTEERDKQLKISIDKQYKEIRPATKGIGIDEVKEETTRSSKNKKDNAYLEMPSFDLHLSQA